MSKPKPPMADRFYEKLLRLLPFDFRENNGQIAERFFLTLMIVVIGRARQ